MKRKTLYCLMISFVVSIMLCILTSKLTSIGNDIIFVFLAYFMLTFLISFSTLAFKKNKKSKVNKYALLSSADALIVVLSFIFSLCGTIPILKNIASLVFVFSFILLAVFCVLWSKYENFKNQLRNL